jgi:hypothetical protein
MKTSFAGNSSILFFAAQQFEVNSKSQMQAGLNNN